MITKEKYLDIFLSVLTDIMIRNNYENLNWDQIMTIRNTLRDYNKKEMKNDQNLENKI